MTAWSFGCFRRLAEGFLILQGPSYDCGHPFPVVKYRIKIPSLARRGCSPCEKALVDCSWQQLGMFSLLGSRVLGFGPNLSTIYTLNPKPGSGLIQGPCSPSSHPYGHPHGGFDSSCGFRV